MPLEIHVDDGAHATSIGFNPIYMGSCSKVELAGVSVRYSGSQQVGMFNHWPGNGWHIHHNVFMDTGKALVNRHGADSKAVLFTGVSGPDGVALPAIGCHPSSSSAIASAASPSPGHVTAGRKKREPDSRACLESKRQNLLYTRAGLP